MTFMYNIYGNLNRYVNLKKVKITKLLSNKIYIFFSDGEYICKCWQLTPHLLLKKTTGNMNEHILLCTYYAEQCEVREPAQAHVHCRLLSSLTTEVFS